MKKPYTILLCLNPHTLSIHHENKSILIDELKFLRMKPETQEYIIRWAEIALDNGRPFDEIVNDKRTFQTLLSEGVPLRSIHIAIADLISIVNPKRWQP